MDLQSWDLSSSSNSGISLISALMRSPTVWEIRTYVKLSEITDQWWSECKHQSLRNLTTGLSLRNYFGLKIQSYDCNFIWNLLPIRIFDFVLNFLYLSLSVACLCTIICVSSQLRETVTNISFTSAAPNGAWQFSTKSK